MEQETTEHNDKTKEEIITEHNQNIVSGEDMPLEPNYSQMVHVYQTHDELTEDLLKIDRQELLAALKQSFNDKLNWLEHCKSIDSLRTLNKYCMNETKEILKVFWDDIITCMESERSALSKNAQIFAQEIFLNSSQNVDLQVEHEVIDRIFYLILKYSISDKKFLKNEAAKTLKILSNNCLYDDALLGFCKECFNKNIKICEIAAECLCKQIISSEECLSNYKAVTIKEVLLTIGKIMYSNKKAKMLQESKKALTFIYQKLGKENYEKYVEILQSEEKNFPNENYKIGSIANLTSVYKAEKKEAPRKSIKELMAEKKKLAMQKADNNEIKNELYVKVADGKANLENEDMDEL